MISGIAVEKTLSVTTGDTADKVAAKIKDAFATGLTGWTATNTTGSVDIVINADGPADDVIVSGTITN